MTREEASKVCGLLVGACRNPNGTVSGGIAITLKGLFPGFNWRVILDRSGERTKARLTIEDNDPREHYFGRLGGACAHCGKTARELAVPEESRDEEDG